MKRKLSPLAVSLCLLGMMSVPAFAADTHQDVDQLAQQVSQLQQQVAALQAELATGHHHKIKKPHHSAKNNSSDTVVKAAKATAAEPEKDTDAADVGELPTNGLNYLPVDLDVPGQSFVSSGPYIGVPFQYSGFNLIVNTPSVNNDVALLQVRKNVHQRLSSLGVTEDENHAHVLLSGIVEGQGMYKNIGGGPDSSDIDISTATLDAYILGPSEWLSSLISFTYDNNRGTDSGSLANNSRVQNARVYLRQVFVTVGNLNKTPFYGTFGQLYVPFGTYRTSMVSTPLTESLARTKQRAVVLGYQPQGDDVPYAAAYAFRGDTHVGSTSRVNNGGVNLGYRFSAGNITGDFGGGMIANIADSAGMQAVSNSDTYFNGFGGASKTGSETIAHRVPAYNLRGILGISEHIDLIAEYISATKQFSATDMTMNYHGAKPQAFNSEAIYTFDAFSHPTSLGVGYARTKDALALQLPQQRYSLVLNTSVWHNTLQSLEFRHDINYGASNVATGSGVAAPTASGKADNAVTAQFDVYF